MRNDPMTAEAAITPELTRPVLLEKIDAQGFETEIVATEAEREKLAKRFSLLGIGDLHARVVLTWMKGRRRLRLRGHLSAHVTQSCVVSLEPVEETVDEEIEIDFEPVRDGASEREIVVTTAEEAEPLQGDILDIGEVIAEELALSLNPYPRHADCEVADLKDAPEPDSLEDRPRPFEKLARFRRAD